MLEQKFDKRIADLGTKTQQQSYELWCNGNSQRQISKQLGKHRSSIQDSLHRLEKKAVKSGLLNAYTEEAGAGAGRFVGKVTTHIKNGEINQEWIRTDNTVEDVMAHLETAVKVLSEDINGNSEIITAPLHNNKDLVSVYPLFDKHFGMMAWGDEVGEDYDLSIAKSRETSIFKYLVDSQPDSKDALIVFGGDYFHCDDDNQVTPAHKNKVDVDGRSFKVFGVGVEMAKTYIKLVLQKHKHVTVEVIAGNHDPVLTTPLLYVLHAYYSNNKRVTVVFKPCRFSYYEFGNTLIAFQHGDKMKQERMYQVVTSDQREAWGRVKYCHIFTGHFHRERTIDIGLCKLESLRTTIPNEAYATDAGYRSPRTAYAITFSRNGGEVGRTMQNI